jgi:O-antigen/teichoic acid export membrane protein
VTDTDRLPWEEPGAVRRDCEPHRGQLLLWLGSAGAACGLLSCLFLIPAVGAIGLGIAVEAMARADLAKMRQGRMDRGGKARTQRSRYWADVGGALGGLVAMAVLVLLAADPNPMHPLRAVFVLLAVAAASLYAWWFQPWRK